MSTITRGYRDLTGWVTSFGEVLALGVEGTGSWGAGLRKIVACCDFDASVPEEVRRDLSDRIRPEEDLGHMPAE